MAEIMRATFNAKFLGLLESNYERMEPVEAYKHNTEVIADAVHKKTITIRESLKFLEYNGNLLRGKGFDPWEVICGHGLQW